MVVSKCSNQLTFLCSIEYWKNPQRGIKERYRVLKWVLANWFNAVIFHPGETVKPSSPSMLCASSDRLDLCYQAQNGNHSNYVSLLQIQILNSQGRGFFLMVFFCCFMCCFRLLQCQHM